jgi:hypothetical protein
MHKPRITICSQNTTYAISIQLLCYGSEIQAKELTAHSAKDTADLLFSKIKSERKGGRNTEA